MTPDASVKGQILLDDVNIYSKSQILLLLNDVWVWFFKNPILFLP